jgi:hypothetical protein
MSDSILNVNLNLDQVRLQLGDILQIQSPTDESINNKQYLITFINNEQIVLFSEEQQQITIHLNEDGSLKNQSIESIMLLSRADTPSYARQHQLLPSQWIDIHFGGDLPTIFTGQITNLEEDQIEIQLVEPKDTIYIDFAYQGIPLDLPIEQIVLRQAPHLTILPETTEQQPSHVPEKEQEYKEDDNVEPEKELDAEADIDIDIDDEDTITYLKEQASPEKIREHIKQIFLNADQIQFGDALQAITQVVEVPEYEKRFPIEKQTDDLLNELLSDVPNAQRSQSVLQTIHLMIERFKQLRQEFSKFDNQGNAFMPDIQGAQYKPLVQSIEKLNKKLYWLLPVVSLKKKVYDIEDASKLNETSLSPFVFGDERIRFKQIVNHYKKGNIPDGQNSYGYMMKEMNTYMRPFENIDDKTHSNQSEPLLQIQEVNTHLQAVISNLNEFESYVINNKKLTQRKFVIQTYNLGDNTLETSKIKGTSGVIVQVKPITKPDTITIKSILMLPYPAIRFSSINLPSTDILTKSNLNQHFIQYWKLLNENKTTPFTKQIPISQSQIQSKTERETSSSIPFLNRITHFVPQMDITEQSQQQEQQPTLTTEQYIAFLKKIIPKTRDIFVSLKQYIHGKVSLHAILQLLEPFLIYQKDISFKQYQEMTSFIQEKIREFKSSYVSKKRELSILDHGRTPPLQEPSMLQWIKLEDELYQSLMNNYQIRETTHIRHQTTSEFLTWINQFDYGNMYHSVLINTLRDLMIQQGLEMLENTEEWIERFELLKHTDGDNGGEEGLQCNTFVLSKRYSSLEQLEKDQGNQELVFDKEFDKTYYDIIEEYRVNLEPIETQSQKIDYLSRQLMQKVGMSHSNALREAEAMILGRRLVKDGDYAVFIDGNGNEVRYYKRVNHQWILDDTMDTKMMAKTNADFCQSQDPGCVFKPKTNTCETFEDATHDIQKQTLVKIMNEFDKSMNENIDTIQKRLETQQQEHTLQLQSYMTLFQNQRMKYDRIKYNLGLDYKREIELGKGNDASSIKVSPYSRLLSYILSQADFVKRQMDISKFVSLYTRPYIESDGENQWWLYCIQTSTKLLPTFISKLAETFIRKEDYFLTIRQIATDQGTLSSDGEAVVDKHSGWIITRIDFSTEEGYNEDGFLAKTRDVLETDLGELVLQQMQQKQQQNQPLVETKIKMAGKDMDDMDGDGAGKDKLQKKGEHKYELDEAKKIYRILHAISRNMGIENAHLYEEWVIQETLKLMSKTMPTKEQYGKLVEKAMAKGKKKMDSYELTYNQTLMIITLSYLFIAIQTNIPSIRTRKTYPTCIKSLSGYPMDGEEDKTGLTYIACVANGIKSHIEPWNSLQKLNEKKLVEKMEAIMNTFILKTDIVKQRIQQKHEYLSEHKDEEKEYIPDEHSIKKWVEFMPSLQSIQVKASYIAGLQNEFKDEFMDNLRKANRNQDDKINWIRAKIIYASLSIQNAIQNAIQEPILRNMASNQPFIENACCNTEDNDLSTGEYFEKRVGSIRRDDDFIRELRNILADVDRMSKAPILYDPSNTRRKILELEKQYSEETIYRAMIHYCRYNTDEPITEEKRAICRDKPTTEEYNKLDTIQDKVDKLKKSGRVFNQQILTQLMDIIHKENIITSQILPQTQSQLNTPEKIYERIRELLELFEETNTHIFPRPFREKCLNLLDSLETQEAQPIENEKLTRMLRTYISASNESMITKIGEFMRRYLKQGKGTKAMRECMEYISTIDEFIDTQDNTSKDKVVLFIQQSIYMLLKVLPSIVMNRVNYQGIGIPKHWNLSSKHEQDIQRFVGDFYSGLSQFFEDETYSILFKQYPSNEILEFIQLTSMEISFFDASYIVSVFKYYFLTICVSILELGENSNVYMMDTIQQQEQGTKVVPELSGLETTTMMGVMMEQVQDTATEAVIQHPLDIMEGEKKSVNEKLALWLYQCVNIIYKSKQSINYSYETLMEKITRAKEKEKTLITDYLKEMTDEEREIEKLYKNHKLERWAVGQQKGFRIYQGDVYDKEREAMEEQYLKELKFKNVDEITEMNRDIFMMGMDEEQRRAKEIEDEVNQIEVDYGDGNGEETMDMEYMFGAEGEDVDFS